MVMAVTATQKSAMKRGVIMRMLNTREATKRARVPTEVALITLLISTERVERRMELVKPVGGEQDSPKVEKAEEQGKILHLDSHGEELLKGNASIVVVER